LELAASAFPAAWDVDSAYVEAHGVASTYLSAANAPLAPTLALRLGGKRVWGYYPFQSSAFIGDAATVRLGRQNRYGGDAAAYANAELRTRISRIFLVLPGYLGLFALADVGRVYLEGELSDRWHNAIGGGIWVSFLDPANTLSVAVARSEVGTTLPKLTSIYVQGGFAF
jgi:hemolysin activation/secretion protein